MSMVHCTACELFIRSLTVRAWAFTEHANRHTLQRRDLLCAIMSLHEYDFLIDITTQTLAEVQGELPPPPIPLGNPPCQPQAGVSSQMMYADDMWAAGNDQAQPSQPPFAHRPGEQLLGKRQRE